MRDLKTSIKRRAVKALRYNSAGEILIQQRDFNSNLKWPGAWNLFGGELKIKETFKNGIIRELTEELGCVPGEIEKEFFEWTSKDNVLNKCFSIKSEITKPNLNLMKAMI